MVLSKLISTNSVLPLHSECLFAHFLMARSIKTISNQVCMCVLSATTRCSPAGLSSSTPPRGLPSLRPSKRTVSPRWWSHSQPSRCFVGSVVTDWAMSLSTTVRRKVSHDSEYSATRSSLSQIKTNSKSSWGAQAGSCSLTSQPCVRDWSVCDVDRNKAQEGHPVHWWLYDQPGIQGHSRETLFSPKIVVL